MSGQWQPFKSPEDQVFAERGRMGISMRKMNAHDAWWFLHDHHKFKIADRTPISPERKDKTDRSHRTIQDPGGNYWLEWPTLYRHALTENLDIHYAMVDETETVNDDHSKNVNVECWLEFGEMKWGYHQPEFEAANGDREYKIHYHDTDLDCGAPTFDEALVELAELVKAKYGTYDRE